MAAEHAPSTPLPHPLRLLRRDLAGSCHPRSRLRSGFAVFDQIGRPAPDAVTWLWARTDLDLATVARARRDLSAVVRPGRNPGSVLVYLGHECFVDLRGLRLLVDTARQVRFLDGALAVVAPPHCLERLMQVGQAHTELPLVSTARQAVWWVRTRGTGLL